LLVAAGSEKIKAANMSLQIDDAFIGRWHLEYDDPRIGGDDRDYETLVTTVARELSSRSTISKKTFLEIWKWKGAMRVIRHVKIEQYDTLYAVAFHHAASEPPERKLSALLAGGKKLPGVGAPTGSTIIHFIHPETMPIIDVRTVEVLFEACLIPSKHRDLKHYERFREAIGEVRQRCPKWSLRQIDRALFAYHKRVLDKKVQEKKCQLDT
jgi:hypothetical protein